MSHEVLRRAVRHATDMGPILVLAMGTTCFGASALSGGALDVQVQESSVYVTTDAHNGADPLWNYHDSNIARTGETVWVSGLHTVPGLPPLNNTECKLWEQTATGWRLAYTLPGLTREPCAIGVLHGTRLVVSTNATLNPRGQAGGGPVQPALWEYDTARPNEPPVISLPRWRSEAQLEKFTEHSYRSLAVDGKRGEIFMLRNVGQSHAEWTFRNSQGQWSSQGRLDWPLMTMSVGRDQPRRIAYVVALVSNRAVHLMGVSDVVEPNQEWRALKYELTGREWDYVFRRLYYTWTPDITSVPFRPWLELENYESTAGWIVPGDLWLAEDGVIHAVWAATALDERLRDRYFPGQLQRREIGYATILDGRITKRRRLMEAREGRSQPSPITPRFFPTPDGRLFLLFSSLGQGPVATRRVANYLAEIRGAMLGPAVRVPLNNPLSQYVIATPRLGNSQSFMMDMLGRNSGSEQITLWHANIQLKLGKH